MGPLTSFDSRIKVYSKQVQRKYLSSSISFGGSWDNFSKMNWNKRAHNIDIEGVSFSNEEWLNKNKIFECFEINLIFIRTILKWILNLMKWPVVFHFVSIAIIKNNFNHQPQQLPWLFGLLFTQLKFSWNFPLNEF